MIHVLLPIRSTSSSPDLSNLLSTVSRPCSEKVSPADFPHLTHLLS